jgi:hypothetical protein
MRRERHRRPVAKAQQIHEFAPQLKFRDEPAPCNFTPEFIPSRFLYIGAVNTLRLAGSISDSGNP